MGESSHVWKHNTISNKSNHRFGDLERMERDHTMSIHKNLDYFFISPKEMAAESERRRIRDSKIHGYDDSLLQEEDRALLKNILEVTKANPRMDPKSRLGISSVGSLSRKDLLDVRTALAKAGRDYVREGDDDDDDDEEKGHGRDTTTTSSKKKKKKSTDVLFENPKPQNGTRGRKKEKTAQITIRRRELPRAPRKRKKKKKQTLNQIASNQMRYGHFRERLEDSSSNSDSDYSEDDAASDEEFVLTKERKEARKSRKKYYKKNPSKKKTSGKPPRKKRKKNT